MLLFIYEINLLSKEELMSYRENNLEDAPYTITENDIIQFLIDNSSKGHMVSGREIYAAMYKLRYHTDRVDTWSDSTTYNVYRTLDNLVARSQQQGFYYGLKLHVEKVPDSMDNSSRDLRKYYVEGPLSDSQIRILRDAISVYSFANPTETKDIIFGLNRLTPEYNQEPYDPKRVSAIKYHGSYYQNIAEICKALSRKKYIPEVSRSDKEMIGEDYDDISLTKDINTIQFKYCEYNSKKELVIKKPKHPIDENDTDLREVNPVKLMWTNGFYYLVTCMPSKEHGVLYANYRVDRMRDVKCTDKKAMCPPGGFNEVDFKNRNPVMYSESVKYAVTMICSRKLINNVIDTFGFDVTITDIDEKRVRVDMPRTSPSGVKMWALEYSYGCEIISPMILRKELKEAAEKMLRTYDRDPTKL